MTEGKIELKVETKYLVKDEFDELLSFDFKSIILYSNDTINEYKIIEKIKKKVER